MQLGGALFAGIGAGIASLWHCAAMCGPLAGFACSRGGSQNRQLGLFHSGRVVAYGLLGAGAALLGRQITELLSFPPVLIVAVILSLGLVAHSWRRWAGPPPVKLQPRQTARPFSRLLGVARHPFALGCVSALLPCAALWIAVALAAGAGHWLPGAILMMSFSATTGIATTAVAKGLTAVGAKGRRGQALVAIAMLASATLILYAPVTNWLKGPAADTASCPLHSGESR